MWNEGWKTFTSGEALLAKRRVKISGATVVYADAGEEYVGVTMADCASGADVSVKLRNAPGTFEVTAAGAYSAAAALYGAADGKVDDVSSGYQQFTAYEAATADGDITEAVPYPMYGQQVSGAVTLEDGATSVNGGIPFILVKAFTDGAPGSNKIWDSTCPFKTRVIDFWIIATDGNTGTITLKNGANAITDALAHGASDKAIVRAGTIDDAYYEVAAAGTLDVVTATGGAGDAMVLCVRVS